MFKQLIDFLCVNCQFELMFLFKVITYIYINFNTLIILIYTHFYMIIYLIHVDVSFYICLNSTFSKLWI